jgi:hypothetical protein
MVVQIHPLPPYQPRGNAMHFVSNPHQEFEDIVSDVIINTMMTRAETVPAVVQAVNEWMNRNGIVFYQP